MRIIIAAAGLLSLASPALHAQAPEQRGLTVLGIGDLRLPPDRAVVRFGVASRASTAAAAGAESARRARAISDTLRQWGLAPEVIEPVALVIATNESSAEGRLVDYEARTVIGVELRQLDRLGALVDAGLSAGATTIPTVRFESDTADRADRHALALAYRDAEAKARAVAAAAGLRLGSILEVQMGDGFSNRYADTDMSDYLMEAPNRVVRKEVRITERVAVRWALVQSKP